MFSSFVIYLVEKDDNPQFKSFADALWWGVVSRETCIVHRILTISGTYNVWDRVINPTLVRVDIPFQTQSEHCLNDKEKKNSIFVIELSMHKKSFGNISEQIQPK